MTIHRSHFRPLKPLAILASLLATGLAAPMAAHAQAQPEMHTGFTPKKAVRAKSFMISAANPHAVRAGYGILKRGGSAIDAAIAASLVLGLVEAQSSGIGGGGYLLHWPARDRRVDSYDGRSQAPAAVRPDHFLEAYGTPVRRRSAHFGGRTVGVPGVPRLLELAHRRHGKLPWKDLFQPAIELAERGFAISPRLHKQINRNRKQLRDPVARAYLLDANGEAWPAGHLLVNWDYAATLRALAAKGADAFYTGSIAYDIAKAVTLAVEHPVPMTIEDVRSYRVVQNAPACVAYRRHRVCGGGPSTTGGITLGMTLALLAPFDLRALGPGSPDAVHLFIEASRLAFADRTHYIADPAFVSVPVFGLLDRGYLARRAKRTDPNQAMSRPGPGNPPMKKAMRTALDDAPEPPSTSHLSVVDAGGIRITGYMAKTVVAVLDWDMDIQSAIELPHFGGADPRREGVVMGD